MTKRRWWRIAGSGSNPGNFMVSTVLVYTVALCHRQIYMKIFIHHSKIRPCERKKMQFILIGKLDNISIKLVA